MIIVELMGGLGNQMFQYALGRHFSIKMNTALFLDREYYEFQHKTGKGGTLRTYDLDIYGIDIAKNRAELNGHFKFSWLEHYILGKSYHLRCTNLREKSFTYDDSILNLNTNEAENIVLTGFWQSWKYFHNIEHVIRKDFVLHPDSQSSKEYLNLLNAIKSEESVCISVRRGDYINDMKYVKLDKAYFERAKIRLEEMRRGSNLKYYMFTDDEQWCREQFSDWSNLEFFDDKFSGPKYRNKFLAMMTCKHFIIPNSTFPWWAAWLSNDVDKKVFVPDQWFTENTIPMVLDDIYPKDWYIIETKV